LIDRQMFSQTYNWTDNGDKSLTTDHYSLELMNSFQTEDKYRQMLISHYYLLACNRFPDKKIRQIFLIEQYSLACDRKYPDKF